ncbi:MAG: hypothetical protein K8L97_26845 [Anaerolineae bacterium]|nr:hypothetical protein [Anaerolineae bacterium]
MALFFRRLFFAAFILCMPFMVAAQDSGSPEPPLSDDDLIVPLVPENTPLPASTPRPQPTAVPPYDPEETTPGEWVYPLSGIWLRSYTEGTKSGDCDAEGLGGDNDGPGSPYNPQDPSNQAQLCESIFGGVVILDNHTYRSNRNGPVSTWTTEAVTDSYDGVTTQRIMTVIDYDKLDVVQTQQKGTCTITYVTHYTLYIPGRPFGCSASLPQYTEVNEQGTPIAPEEEPVEQEEQEVIIEPIVAGEYEIEWLPFDTYCSANYAPTFTSMSVTPTSFDDVKLIINGEPFELSGDGMRGEFNYYGDDVYVTLNRRLMEDFNFVWQATSPDNSESCYAQGVVTIVTPAENQPAFQSPSDNGGVSSGGAVALPPPEAGSYTAVWESIPSMECPADLIPAIPNFSAATIDSTDSSFTITSDIETYEVEIIPGAEQWMYMDFKDDNSGVVITFTDIQPGLVTGTYSYFAADGQYCMMTLELTQ